MTDAIAHDLLKSYFRRWQALEEEKQSIQQDLKELFVEARANGFDGKAIRAAFRKVAKADDASEQEHEAIVDLYVSALTSPSRAHTRDAREGDHEITETGAGAFSAVKARDRLEDAVGVEPPAPKPFQRKALRPHCLKPECCGSSDIDHCWICKKALAESEAVA